MNSCIAAKRSSFRVANLRNSQLMFDRSLESESFRLQSTTEAGWEGNAKEVYVSRLVGELAQRGVVTTVVNAGISNTTSRQAVARLDADVRQQHPDIVIVQFGITIPGLMLRWGVLNHG